MITFAHITDTRNVGDLASGPYHYFRFLSFEVVNYASRPAETSEAVIYGGGTLTGWLRSRGDNLPNMLRIAWGVGSTRHGDTVPWPDPEGFDLLGIREWSEERENAGQWVPCASCMSQLFDVPYPVKHDAVLFVNADTGIKSRYPHQVRGLPVMENTGSLADTIRFLGSGKVVVTNSYHGVYWATLLGRPVVCIPYSSKFHGFKHPPAMSDNGSDWASHSPAVYPEALEECREANRGFFKKVMEALP